MLDSPVLQSRNNRWHFPDKDNNATKRNEVPHNQHSDPCSFENVVLRASQFHGLSFPLSSRLFLTDLFMAKEKST